MPAPSDSKAAWLAVACAFLGSAEGLRTVAYLDPVGIPTGCFGETEGVELGERWTVAECNAKLGDRLVRVFGPAVDRCAGDALPPRRKAAYVSLAYNIGTSAFCTSSVARRERAGDVAGACAAILLYNKMRVVGVLVYSPGLANRRGRENLLCLSESPSLSPVVSWAGLSGGPLTAGGYKVSWQALMPPTVVSYETYQTPAPNKYATPARPAINWRAI